MLFDRVDAVRRSAAEQLVMAARIDLDRCPARHLHHVPGACTRETRLPSLRPRQPSPEPNPTSAAHSVTEPVQQGVDAADAGPGQGEEDLASDPNATMPPQGVKEGDESTFEYRVDARTCVGASPQTEDDPPRAPEGSGEVGEGAEVCPRDRGGACGMWLRLVMAPLMRECLEASYRGKLLALHMTQVGRKALPWRVRVADDTCLSVHLYRCVSMCPVGRPTPCDGVNTPPTPSTTDG